MPPGMSARTGAAPPGVRGVTLLELVIAILVLSLGTVAAFRAIDQARHTAGDGAGRFLALQVALNRAEELRVADRDEAARLPERVDLGGHAWALRVSRVATAAGFTEATVTVSSDGLPGAQVVAILPGEPMP